MAHADGDHGDAEPITDHMHDSSWSANLEGPQHAADRELLVSQALEAVEKTESGYHVNLVTHGDQGHPSEYLYAVLDDENLDYEYIQQCGCGGHVTRVHVE